MKGREFDAVVLGFQHRLRVRLSRALVRWSQVVGPPACDDPRCCFRPGTRPLSVEPCPPPILHWPADGNWEGGYVDLAGRRWHHVPNVGWERR